MKSEQFLLFVGKQNAAQQITSHDLLEILLICWFGDQETFLINVESSFAAQCFCGKRDFVLFLINRRLFESFCSII